MKLIINLLRILIGFYITALIFVMLAFYTSKKYNQEYPSVSGYSYYVVDDYHLESLGMPKGTFVIIKKDTTGYNAKEGDLVLYRDGELYKLVQIKQENASDMEIDTYLVGYPDSTELEYVKLKKKDVISEYYYHSSILTLCYKIFTNWMTLLILILFLFLSPSLIYKRFEL